MSDYDRPPDLAAIVRNTQARIAALERPHVIPAAEITASGQSTTNGVLTQLDFDGTTYDTALMAALADDRINVRVGGLYVVSARSGWADNGTGDRQTWITKNGSVTWPDIRATAGAGPNTYATLTVPALLSAGDWVSLKVQQGSGGALTASATLSLFWVNPGPQT